MKCKINLSLIISEISVKECCISKMKFSLSQRISDCHKLRINIFESLKHKTFEIRIMIKTCNLLGTEFALIPVHRTQFIVSVQWNLETSADKQKAHSACTRGIRNRSYILEFKGLHKFLKWWGTDRENIAALAACFMLVSSLAFSPTLKAEDICPSETSVDYQQSIWHYIREYRPLPNHHYENHKAYMFRRTRVCNLISASFVLCFGPLLQWLCIRNEWGKSREV